MWAPTLQTDVFAEHVLRALSPTMLPMQHRASLVQRVKCLLEENFVGHVVEVSLPARRTLIVNLVRLVKFPIMGQSALLVQQVSNQIRQKLTAKLVQVVGFRMMVCNAILVLKIRSPTMLQFPHLVFPVHRIKILQEERSALHPHKLAVEEVQVLRSHVSYAQQVMFQTQLVMNVNPVCQGKGLISCEVSASDVTVAQ